MDPAEESPWITNRYASMVLPILWNCKSSKVQPHYLGASRDIRHVWNAEMANAFTHVWLACWRSNAQNSLRLPHEASVYTDYDISMCPQSRSTKFNVARGCLDDLSLLAEFDV